MNTETQPAPSVQPVTVGWRLAWVAALLVIAGYFLMPLGMANQLYYLSCSNAAALVILGAVRVLRPVHVAPWYLLALSLVAASAGNAAYSYYDLIAQEPPYPSLADVCFFVQKFFAAGALWLMVRRRTSGRDWASVIDATIVSIGTGLSLWMFVVAPFVQAQTLPLLDAVVGLGYPMMDIVIASLGLRLLWGPDARTNSALVLLTSSYLVAVVVNAVYLVMLANGTYYFGHPLDALWLSQFALLALAALHPSMRRVAELQPHAAGAQLLSGRRMLALGTAAVAAPFTLLIGVGPNDMLSLRIRGMAALIMFTLVLLRMRGLVHSLESSVEQIAASRAERGRLLEQTVWTGESERRRVAAELHDGPIQGLAATGYVVDVMASQFEAGDTDSARELVRSIQRSLSAEIEGMRKIMTDLRPPALDQRGLEEALRDCVSDLQARTAIEACVDLRLPYRVSASLEIILYRVAQEALANTGKHSEARRVHVELGEQDGQIRMRISDDGIGFDAGKPGGASPPGHAGLAIMRERVELSGGTWTLTSVAGNGTTITAAIPTEVAA